MCVCIKVMQKVDSLAKVVTTKLFYCHRDAPTHKGNTLKEHTCRCSNKHNKYIYIYL